MKKILSKRNVSLSCILLVLILIGYFSFSLVSPQAKAEEVTNEKIVYLTEEKYSFTNSDIVNGIDVKQYATDYYAKNIESVILTNKIVMTVNGPDDIVKILPEKFFKEPGKTFHLGKEWGFFVDCFQPNENVDLLVTTVILFDLHNNNDMTSVETKTHLTFNFNRILQADFSYVPNTEENMYSIGKKKNPYFNDSYPYNVSLIYNDNLSSRIIALPTRYNKEEEIKWIKTFDGDSSIITGNVSESAAILQHNKYFFY